MVSKWAQFTELREGSYAFIEDTACIIKKIDISKTGKHGSMKVRIEAIGVIDGKKRVIVKPGHEKVGIPMIEKKKGQILSVGEKATIMDVESFETLEVEIPEELKGQLSEGLQVEYWDVEGAKIIKRTL